ncbi:DUF6036 family nucleotidyltransferase [Gracilimonas sp.]|uniref:DUF6036 family nucleotidyltransferase n=1 Tax=Gracilimonas sp. TaxID=1974203 RepID=UPI003D143C3E
MNREQLEHAIRSACEVSGDNELYIFGSQAILGQFPQADEKLTRSIEVDASPKNKPEAVDRIDGALGENSPFHHTHGFYVHGVSIETASLPEGWEERTNKVQNYMDENNIGWCVEAHDLAASKLIAYREKDIRFVRTLLIEELITVEILADRIPLIETDKSLKERALNWLTRTTKEL